MPLMKRVNSKGHPANGGGAGMGADFESVFQHFQALNNQIEQKTRQVFDSVNKFNDPVDKDGDDSSPRPMSAKSQAGRPKSAAAVDKKKDQQLIVELHQRLQASKHDYECLSRKHKLLEEEKQKQELELIDSEENVKKLKGQLAAKHRQSEVQKKDTSLTLEKLKLEEQTRRNLQKELDTLSKQLSTVMSEKDKLEEKLERCKMDNEVIKKYKICDNTNSRVPLMMRCIRKQATLIDNLMEQIAILEQHGAVSDK